jgi:hypothetical protein
MKWVRRPLILVHRYLGMVLSLLFVMWFISGIGMMYARGMPGLTRQLRLLRLPEIDLSKVRFTPLEAAAKLGGEEGGGALGRVVVGAILDRPVYRLGAGRGGSSIVFADDGTVLDGVDAEMAKAIAARFMNVPEDKLHYSLHTEVDQWTIGQRRQLPLHKITVDDDARTELYLSPQSGDVSVLTTRGSRALAWVAAIPHWMYFTALRTNDRLWRQVVLWASGLGCVLALAGIILGFTQFKFSRPFKLRRIPSYIPYSGWMRWHYITGFIFGILTLTWVFSGMLSMEPWSWASAPGLQGNLRGLLTGGALDPEEFPQLEASAWKGLLTDRKLKEIEYTRIQGEPYFIARSVPAGEVQERRTDRVRQEYDVQFSADPDRTLISAKTLQIRNEPFSVESLMSRVKEAYPDTPIVESAVLTEYDSYYYSRDRQAPLPVLRVKFADPAKTWIYVDPQMSQQAGSLHRLDRVERWIYNGFHSLDFAFWYSSPVWDAGVILLSLGGTAVSLLGVYLGFKRLIRSLKRTAESS